MARHGIRAQRRGSSAMWRAAIVPLLLPLGVACNAIWGVDAPTLAGSDAGKGDGKASDARGSDGEKDATHPDAARDGAADATPDSMPSDGPEIFDGRCSCDDASCAPVVIASGQLGPGLVVTDPNGVYWTTNGSTTPGTGSVVAATFDGKVTSLATSQSNPFGIGVASGMLAWVQVSGGQIDVCSLPGCAMPAVLMPTAPGLGDVALNKSTVFFEALNEIESCPVTGCGKMPTQLSALKAQGGIAIDDVSVYWADQALGTINSCPLDGCCDGLPDVLATGEDSPSALVIADGHLYWTDAAGEIRACTIDMCAAETLVAGGSYTPHRLAVDSAHVYFTDPLSGVIGRVPLGGGKVVNLESSENMPGGIAVGTSCVFWTESPEADAGEIRATAK
jgi:hypothetical protein